jgi:hypothetical protein
MSGARLHSSRKIRDGRDIAHAVSPSPPHNSNSSAALAKVRERCANLDDIPARVAAFTRFGIARAPRDTRVASRDDARARRFVVTGVADGSRIVCRHAGLNASTALHETLRPRVREILFNFLRVPFDCGPVDRKREGAITTAFEKEKFLLAAAPSSGGIKHDTVRTHSIPRGRTGITFLSRARQVVCHSRESDPGGGTAHVTPSRPGFPREGTLQSEEFSSVDQGGPK